jgi:hypothetical protein
LGGHVSRREANATASWTAKHLGGSLADVCEVSVGALVAYRDPGLGPWRAYVDARSRSGVPEMTPLTRRRFAGSVTMPPFVVIARTNRPARGSGPRVQATVMRGERPIAVENHLLVLTPHDHTVRGCRAVVEILESPRATAFLDGRLRCRHLTVGAVGEIPR